MLAKLGDKALERKSFIYEPKLDGTRVLIYKDGTNIELINRRGRNIAYRYPELLDIGQSIKAKSCVLDSELVVLNQKGNPDFNLLQQREQLDNKLLIQLRSRKWPATLFVFDVLELEGKSLIDKSLRERKRILQKLIDKSPFIVLCPWTTNGKALWQQVQQQGLEGVIAKEINSRYEQGKRSEAWLKIKNLNTIDAVVVGFTKGEATRASTFGALVLATYDPTKQQFIYVGRVGTGFNQTMLKQLTERMKKLKTKKSVLPEEEQKKVRKAINWTKPEVVVEVKYLKLTKGRELRAPSFLRLRFDKKPKECVLET